MVSVLNSYLRSLTSFSNIHIVCEIYFVLVKDKEQTLLSMCPCLNCLCKYLYRLNGMVNCGDRHRHIYERAMEKVEQVKVSEGSAIVTCLLEGPRFRYLRFSDALLFIFAKDFSLCLKTIGNVLKLSVVQW